MNEVTSSMSHMRGIELGIQGLHGMSINMRCGGVYALEARTPSARFPLLASSLGSALANDMVCTVVVRAKPDQYLTRLESFGNFDAAALAAAHKLHVLVMQNEFQKKAFRFGAERMVQELEHYGIPENSYLVFDHADDLLSLHDVSIAMSQVDTIAAWCEERHVTGLLVFCRSNEAQSAAINALMDSFTGLARLDGSREGLEIVFKYWQSQERLIAARHVLLNVLDSGFYEAVQKMPAAALIHPGADISVFGGFDSGFTDSAYLNEEALAQAGTAWAATYASSQKETAPPAGFPGQIAGGPDTAVKKRVMSARAVRVKPDGDES